MDDQCFIETESDDLAPEGQKKPEDLIQDDGTHWHFPLATSDGDDTTPPKSACQEEE